MARNIEIKARIESVETLLPRAQALADAPAQRLEQDDTFFNCAQGRLKLRDFGDGLGELIHYERPNSEDAKLSDYVRAPTTALAELREVLARAWGIRGRLRKTRLLLFCGQTRIHLDRVEGLGDFLELEVVLREGQSEQEGVAIANTLIAQLGVADAPRLGGAYLELLHAPE